MRLPLPDPRYIAFHAACARVADLSGVGDPIRETIERIEYVYESMNDGSSDTLIRRLMCLQ